MYWTEFLTIAIAHLFAVASPGPDFAVVTRQSVTAGTRAGIWTSLGVGTGILLHVTYCLLGVAVLLASSPALFNGAKLVAALYMLLLSAQAFRASFEPPQANLPGTREARTEPYRAFLLGFMTNGLNPKATLFFLALFSIVIDVATPLPVQIAYGVYLAIATFAWFTMLSSILGRQRVREFMLRAGAWFERGMGLILLGLGMQILWFG